MSIAAVGGGSQITPQQVTSAALKAADNDGDGRRGAAALNDGDAAARQAARTVATRAQSSATPAQSSATPARSSATPARSVDIKA